MMWVVVALLTLALLAVPLAAEAQPAGKVYRIGILCPVRCSDVTGLQQGLRDAGLVEGQNLALELRFADGRPERYPTLAAELAGLGVDVLLTWATQPALALKAASSTVPIVFSTVADPVGAGLVASLARPGAIVTGVTHITPELQGKRVELLRELIPKVSRVAALWNPAYPPARPVWAETQAAAQVLGLALHELTAQRPEDFEGAFTAMARGRAQALVVVPDHMFWRERKRITELAARHRLPAIYEFRDFVDAGGLMSYGTNLSALDRRAAALVEKILKGTKPADLPVERPAKFDLVINLRTAKALGLTIPQSVLLRADEVIE